LPAQGLQGLQPRFLAAQGLHGLQPFLAAQGLQGLQPRFLAAHGLQGLQAASSMMSWDVADFATASGRTLIAPAPARAATPIAVTVFFNIFYFSCSEISGSSLGIRDTPQYLLYSRYFIARLQDQTPITPYQPYQNHVNLIFDPPLSH
jgi:hypothetical protein